MPGIYEEFTVYKYYMMYCMTIAVILGLTFAFVLPFRFSPSVRHIRWKA